jgi:hypothetical protein
MNTYRKLYVIFEKDFFGCLTMGVLLQSIVGGVAAMYELMNGTGPAQMLQLFVTVAACMIYNGAVMAQQTPKVVFNALLASLGANTVLIVANLIF